MLKVKGFVFSPVQENTYIVYNEEKDCCVIDPGCYFSNERKELQQFITENQLQPKYLLNTHCHLDHVFGNKFVFDQYGLFLHIHEKETPVLAYAPISADHWNLPFEHYDEKIVFIKEGQSIQLGNDKLQVLFTPGHSPGHVSFYSAADAFILSGDVLFHKSIGRTDLPGGSFDQLVTTIREQLFVLPEHIKVYSGHGETTTIGYEKKYNPFVGIN